MVKRVRRDTDLPTAVTVINERVGRSVLPMGTEWTEEAIVNDDAEQLHASECRYREHHGTAFVPIENVPDPDSLVDVADRMEAKEQEDEEECERWLLSRVQSTTGTIRCLPAGIRRIIRRFSLPSEQWEKLPLKERIQRRRAIQRGIAQYYLKQGHS